MPQVNTNPSCQDIKDAIDRYAEEANVYASADRAIALVIEQFDKNVLHEHILIKATLINRLYSTNILDIWTLADTMSKISDFDRRLEIGDLDLVIKDMKSIKVNKKNIRTHKIAKVDRSIYSFATKYCNWHNHDKFPIYDRNVSVYFCYMKSIGHFENIKFKTVNDLRNYHTFVSVVNEFSKQFNLQSFNYKQLDKFLWLEGYGLMP